MRERGGVLPGTASAPSAFDWILDLLDEVGSGPIGDRRRRQCPAHDDASPSLAFSVGVDGRALLHCHAGCRLDDVLDALHISRRHLFTVSPFTPAEHVALCRVDLSFPPLQRYGRQRYDRGGGSRSLEAIHPYTDEVQLARYRSYTTREKPLVWERKDSDGIWRAGLAGRRLADLPLYHERQVRMGVAAGEVIVVVESESSVDALTKVGIYATTWAGGASDPNLDRLFQMLAGSDVVLIPDNDAAGQGCAEKILEHFNRRGAPIRAIVPETSGQDARDVLRELGARAFSQWIAT